MSIEQKIIERRYRSRAELISEIEDLPPVAYVSPLHAAALIGTTPGVLANWRSARVGPQFSGQRNFIRYKLSALRTWMAQRENEVLSCGEAACD